MRELAINENFVTETTNKFDWTLDSKTSEVSSKKDVHLIDMIEEKIENNEIFYSFELIPVPDFDTYKRFFLETRKYSPLFYAITWHCNKNLNNFDVNNITALRIAEKLSSPILLHLTARNMKIETAERILNHAIENKIMNIFVLQGDCHQGNKDTGDFTYAADLVRFIRKRFGLKFCICVAGYPQMHPSSPSKKIDLLHLKAKVDSGANFIISQMFFQAEIFIEFVESCRKIDIKVPIIPGIFPISNYESLIKMSSICNVEIPRNLLDALESMKEDQTAVQQFGLKWISRIIEEISHSGTTNGYHLFTLNRSSMVSICDQFLQK